MRIVTLSLFIFLLFSETTVQSQIYKDLSALEFNTLVKSEPGTLLDVRTYAEFANGHIEGASQLNFYEFSFRQKLLLLPKDVPIYIYCNTGYRSKKAAEILIANGYTKIFNLKYGIMEWYMRNLPIQIAQDARSDQKDKMEIDEYQSFISRNNLVFVDFYAPWCAPCKQMMPMIDELKSEYAGRVEILKVNVDASKNLAKQLSLMSVPYFVLYKDGEVVFTHNGLITKEVITDLFSKKINS